MRGCDGHRFAEMSFCYGPQMSLWHAALPKLAYAPCWAVKNAGLSLKTTNMIRP